MNTPAHPPRADAELTISSSHKPKPQAAADRDHKNEELLRKAQEMRERSTAAKDDATEEAAAPPPPRENVDSVEVELNDKRKVVLGPPAGVSLTMRITMTIPEAATNPTLERLARLMMSIRSVDGHQMKPIGSLLEVQKAANEIGDVGIDELNFWYERHWGSVRVSDLQLLKKNLR